MTIIGGSKMSVRVRFAPSPTGFVHMGSLMSSFVERFGREKNRSFAK